MVNINIKFSNKTLYLLIGIITLLAVAGVAIATNPAVHGHPVIGGEAPTIKFEDSTSGEKDYWIHANLGNLYFVWDENNNDIIDDLPDPLRFEGRDAIFGGNITVAGKVQTSQYCDSTGANCKSIGDMGSSSSGATITPGTWCGFKIQAHAGPIFTCDGLDPQYSCPSGYVTKNFVNMGDTYGSNWYTCGKN